MADIVKEVEDGIGVLWTKLVNWWNNTAVPELERDEKAVLALLQPLLAQAEAAAISDLTVFITAVLTQVEKGGDLATLEAAVLNALQTAEHELLDTAKALGSNALQALIGLILAKLPKA